MSTHHIPYPADFDVNYHHDAQVQRAERAFHALHVGDVLAVVDDLIAQEVDPVKHPLHQLTLFLLDQSPACDGGQLYDACRTLVVQAISYCLSEALSQGEV